MNNGPENRFKTLRQAIFESFGKKCFEKQEKIRQRRIKFGAVRRQFGVHK